MPRLTRTARTLGRRAVEGYLAVTGTSAARLLVDTDVRRVAMARPRPLNGTSRLITLEANATLCAVARDTVAAGGLDDRIEVRQGRFDTILSDVFEVRPDYVLIDGNTHGAVRARGRLAAG